MFPAPVKIQRIFLVLPAGPLLLQPFLAPAVAPNSERSDHAQRNKASLEIPERLIKTPITHVKLPFPKNRMAGALPREFSR
jgi:hypothetical protein